MFLNFPDLFHGKELNFDKNACEGFRVLITATIVIILLPEPWGATWLSVWYILGTYCCILKTKSEKEEYLQMIKQGDLNIIIGTHSLLGNRVAYNNLGLLVVDEEQVCFAILLSIIYYLAPN